MLRYRSPQKLERRAMVQRQLRVLDSLLHGVKVTSLPWGKFAAEDALRNICRKQSRGSTKSAATPACAAST